MRFWARGSLIPHLEKRGVRLRISGRWNKNGPFLPIEYARISSNGELTLVLHPGVRGVRTLWAYSAFQNLNKAIKNLRDREGILPKNTHKIGYISIYDNKFNSHVVHCVVSPVRKWAIGKAVDAAGNMENNTVELSTTPSDLSPPLFNGLSGLYNLSNQNGTILLEWDEAVDPSPPIMYNVYMATVSGGQDFNSPNMTTNLTWILVSGLDLVNKSYYFVVRAEDSWGNEDNNTV